MRKIQKYQILIILFLIIVLPSCLREEINTRRGITSQTRDNAKDGITTSQEQLPPSITVRVLPEIPTVTTDLQVVHSGQGTASYEWQRNGLNIIGEMTDRLPKSLFTKKDTIAVIVRADNGVGTASVVIANSLPRVESVPFHNAGISAGNDITVKPIGFDPDGDTVTFHYKWSVNGQDQPEDSPTLPGDRFKRGDTVSLTVIPCDLDGEGQAFISKPMVIPDALPRIVSHPSQHLGGPTYTYQVIAEDPDGGSIRYSLASAPTGMVINNNTGLITWQLGPQSEGSHQIEIVVEKQNNMKSSQKYTLAIRFEGK